VATHCRNVFSFMRPASPHARRRLTVSWRSAASSRTPNRVAVPSFNGSDCCASWRTSEPGRLRGRWRSSHNRRFERTVTHKVQGAACCVSARRGHEARSSLCPAAQPARYTAADCCVDDRESSPCAADRKNRMCCEKRSCCCARRTVVPPRGSACRARSFAQESSRRCAKKIETGRGSNEADFVRCSGQSRRVAGDSARASGSPLHNKRLERTVTHKVQGAPRRVAPRRLLVTRSLLRPAAQPRR
jgi:hypothetical protein